MSDPDDAKLDALGREVEELGRFEAEVLEEAARLPGAPGDELVQPTLEAAFGTPTGRGPARALWVGSGLAAAALVAFGAWWFLPAGQQSTSDPPVSSDPSGPSGTYLSHGTFGEIAVTPTSAGRSVEWSGPEDGRYELTVLDAEDGSEVLGPTVVDGRSFALTGEELSGWPDRVLIELTLLRRDGGREATSFSWEVERP